MDLILWRHAEAEDAPPDGADLARALTARGAKQARHLADWLAPRLPRDVRILCSPARRTQQTASALRRGVELRDELLPDTSPARLLDLVQWPDAVTAVLAIGHQPVLGQTVARLLGLPGGECPIRKGSVWWLRSRPQRQAGMQVGVIAVLSPEWV